MTKPLLAITMGDPAGIGPEVLLRALAESATRRTARFLVIGDERALAIAARRLGVGLRFEKLDPGVNVPRSQWERIGEGCIHLLSLTQVPERTVLSGRADEECGRASVLFFERAIELALARRVDAIVTCPINKKAMNLAGYAYAGHTEILAERTGRKAVMMLVGGGLRVALATTHLALKDVPDRLNIPLIVDTVKIVHEAMKRYFRIEEPRIGLAALNPHASDGGLFGNEESLILEPAVRRLAELGIKCTEPLPADSLFFKAIHGAFDAVVALYHDQGLGPLKMIAFDSAVNVSLGLPIIRTSVDHGTAYDIAGQGKASCSSLREAIRLAASMAGAARK